LIEFYTTPITKLICKVLQCKYLGQATVVCDNKTKNDDINIS